MAAANRSTSIRFEEVAEFLRYDPLSGNLSWIKKPNQRILIGSIAGCIRNSDRGYIVLRLVGRMYYAHRLAWVLKTESDLSHNVVIDHRNGDTTDNRWINLRISTQSQNQANSRWTLGASGVRGVIYDKAKGKWRAQISHQNKCKWLGNFDTIEQASAARRRAEDALFGDFSFRRSRAA